MLIKLLFTTLFFIPIKLLSFSAFLYTHQTYSYLLGDADLPYLLPDLPTYLAYLPDLLGIVKLINETHL